MEFKKCTKCGSFFINDGIICPNCEARDTAKIQNLQNYLENYTTPGSIQELSLNTGIPQNDITRYLNNNPDFPFGFVPERKI